MGMWIAIACGIVVAILLIVNLVGAVRDRALAEVRLREAEGSRTYWQNAFKAKELQTITKTVYRDPMIRLCVRDGLVVDDTTGWVVAEVVEFSGNAKAGEVSRLTLTVLAGGGVGPKKEGA